MLLALGAVFADPMPYDSIGNPLNHVPATDRTVQLKGDSLNIVLNRVRVNQAGYRKMDVAAGYAKFYCVGCVGTTFTVRDASGASAGTGTLTSKGVTVSGKYTAYASNSAEHAYNGDGDWKKGYPLVGNAVSGALTQGILPANLATGRYTIRVGADSSVPFIVSDNVYGMARDAAIKFFGVARSGDYESWYHGPSHMWDGWLLDSAAKNTDGSYKYKGALKGGWYDCGNHLKEARTNSYPLATLGMLAATMPEKDADQYALNQNITSSTDRIPDVLREAWVGAQYVFNSWRLAKGKASDMYLSVGDLSWDFAWWGRPENHDAVLNLTRGGRRERVLKRDWGSASMADFAAGMAFLSRLYRPYDKPHADSALVIAKAMYETAKTANKKEESEDYTADNFAFDDLGLASVALLWATGESKYLQEAVFTKGLSDGVGGICKSTAMSPDKQLRLFEGGFFACDADAGMKKKGGPTDYTTVHSLALYSFAKLILANADTAARYGVRAGQRDTFLLRTITQMPGLWEQSGSNPILIPTGDQYNPTRLTYDSIWYSMGIGFGKSGWWNKYQFGNLADLYMFYDMTGIVDGRQIVDKPGNTDWKRKEVLQVLLGGLNYMMGTNALDVSYLLGIGRKSPMHPHHRAANPEGKNVPGAFYNYTIPVGGLYGGLLTGPSNTEVMVEKFGDYRMTEAICPDAQAAVMIPLMGLARELPAAAPKATVKVLYTTDTMAVIQIDLDKWGSVKLGYGLDSSLAAQTKIVAGSDTSGSVKIQIGGLSPATPYYFHVVATDLLGLTSVSSKWPNGASDSVPFTFTTKTQPPFPPQYGNIKVCNVTSDSAEIMWYTPNGEYLSSVKWADSVNWKAAKYSVVDTDAVGDVPVKFHRVKLYGLKAKTTYNFQVGIPGSYDATVGCFRTPGEDVKFDIRTTHYTWGGMPAMGLAVINQDVKSYDSLQIRLYVNGTRANIVDLAARVDIAFAYRADGFADSGLFSHTKNVQRSRPKLIDPSCNPDLGSCAWYFDLPLHGATMETQARWRLDVVFDRHNLIRDSTEILNMAPTHDPFAGTDWSFRPHVAGADGGLSPVDYSGVPLMSKNAIDSIAMDIPINPYIAVYRRNEFIYGFSPYAAEQATKRVVYAMDATFEKPFDINHGGTVELGTASSTRLKGTLNPYDILMPSIKGYITGIWVNGVALSDAERRASLSRKSDGTWNFDIPLRLVSGTNKVDVTFFAGSDSTESVATGTCTEGKGCAFYNANWYVNYVSNMTVSTISVVDGADKKLGLVVPDSSTLRIRVADGNANASKTALNSVTVSVTNLRTGAMVALALPETGVNTGVFQTDLLKVVSATALAGQLGMNLGDTLNVAYVDAADPVDSTSVKIWSKASWPSLVSGMFVAGCGSNSIVATLDRTLGGAGLYGTEQLVNAGFESPAATSMTEYYFYSGQFGGWTVKNVDVVTAGTPGQIVPVEGSQYLDLNATQAGSMRQVLTTVPGSVVRLGFKYSVNAAPGGTGPAVKMARISWNGATVDTLRWDIATQSADWLSASYDFVATGRDSIDFSSLVDGNQGIMFDEVSIKRWIASTGGGDSILGGRVALVGVAGDTLSRQILSASDVVVGSNGMDLAIRSSATSVMGISGGELSLDIRTKAGKTVSVSVSLGASIGPWIDSAKIVENLSGSPLDTLYLWTSEATKPLGLTLPVVLRRSGAIVSMAGISVDAANLLDASTGKWGYAIRGGVVKAHDSLRWDPTKVADLQGNPALDCPSLSREIKLVPRPAPFAGAWIKDVNGDGQADQVTMVFRKSLVAADLPDSIDVQFGAGAAIRVALGVVAISSDSVLTVPLAKPFPFGQTRGSGANGSGSLTMWKLGEATAPYPLVDSVGPVLLAAKLRFGSSSAFDTLDLEFSEPVRRSTGIGWLALNPGIELSATGMPDSVSATSWKLPVDSSTVFPGDFVHPLATERWSDVSNGNRVGAAHVWVPVSGGERSPVGGWFQDIDGDGAVDLATVVFGKSPRTRSAMELSWPSPTGFAVTKIDSGAWVLNPDGLSAYIAVGPFTKGITSSSTNLLGRWTSNGVASVFPMEDRVAPVIVAATLRYGTDDSIPDTLKVRWSEAIAAPVGQVVFHQNVARGVLPENVIHSLAVPDPDGLGASLLLPPGQSQLRKGDSARLAPAATDAFANAATDPAVWVPVTFGLRPPRLKTELRSFFEYDGIRPLGIGAALETWVWDKDNDRWLRPDGSVPEDVDSTHSASLAITLNQILEGSAHIFDNSGTFVASANFDGIRKMAAEGTLPVDPSGSYLVKFVWDGRTKSGKLATSGVYYMRLVLKFQLEGEGKPHIVNRVYTLGFKRAVK